jgi:excisionase family DNA binding protein
MIVAEGGTVKVPKQVSKYMAEMGKRSARARLKKISPEQRVLIASNAARTRWAFQGPSWYQENIASLLSNRKLEIKDGQFYGFAPADELLDITQLAERLQVPKSTIYELCRHRSRIKGTQLPAFKIGRRLKFRWSAVCDWISTLEKEAQR